MENLISVSTKDYELIDSGYGKKLERISGLLVIRPCPQAIWRPKAHINLWKEAIGECIRKKDGGGEWKFKGPDPTKIYFHYKQCQLQIKFTSFGHTGVFFEQIAVWEKILGELLKLNKSGPIRFLNLFGYTGALTVFLAKHNIEVYHVDSSKGVLNWCLDNSIASSIDDGLIKVYEQDAREFIKIARKKGIIFDGILADPPSWGHGKNKEVWTFEDDINDFVSQCYTILDKNKHLFFLSSHTLGVQQNALINVLNENAPQDKIISGELLVKHHNDSRHLPAGIYAMATSK